MSPLRFLPIVLLLAGCSAARPTVVPPDTTRLPFDEKQYARYAEDGTASVSGDAYVRWHKGERQLQADQSVYLVPVTHVSAALVEHAVETNSTFAPSDARLAPITRQVRTDDEGHFRLERLPRGEYFLVSTFTKGFQSSLNLRPGATPPTVIAVRFRLDPGVDARVNLVSTSY